LKRTYRVAVCPRNGAGPQRRVCDTDQMQDAAGPCDHCGFDHDLYDRGDTTTSQTIIAPVLRAAIEGLDDATLNQRASQADPAIENLSIAEVMEDLWVTVAGHRVFMQRALDPSTSTFALDSTGPAASVTGVLTAVASEHEAIAALVRSLTDDQWDRSLRVGGNDLSVGWFARQSIHDGVHALADVGRIRHHLGHGARPATGKVEQMHVSNGGVPKEPVAAATVGPAGVAGDAQADRRHHGRPIQAVCLWSSDVISSLRAEGHPIAAGNAGENITLSGIGWSELRPGSRITVGPVPMLVSAHAIPCAKNAQWFSDQNFNRILHDRHPGFSRLYAIPLSPGTVSVGDPVVVEPDR